MRARPLRPSAQLETVSSNRYRPVPRTSGHPPEEASQSTPVGVAALPRRGPRCADGDIGATRCHQMCPVRPKPAVPEIRPGFPRLLEDVNLGDDWIGSQRVAFEGGRRQELADGERGSAVTDNPYPTETETNTGSTAWLDGYKTIKADFTTLHGYAQNMLNASMAMMSSAGAVNQIPKFAQDGFAGKPQNAPSGMAGFAGSFPEAQLVQHINNTNFFDFVSMLQELTAGLLNVAYAAQTVCDAYHLNDTSSAKDLNSLITKDGVDFAFGMGGARPEGLSRKLGQTYREQQFEL